MRSNTLLFSVIALASISVMPACFRTSASSEPPAETRDAHGGDERDAEPVAMTETQDTASMSAGTSPGPASTETSATTKAAPLGDSDHGATPAPAPATIKSASTKKPDAPKPASEQAATGSASGSTPAASRQPANPHDGMAMTATLSVANGATVAAGLSKIDISFDHPMSVTSASLKSLAGDTIPVKLPPSGETSKASVTFAGLEADTYTFTWRAKAGDHDMSGSARFTVN